MAVKVDTSSLDKLVKKYEKLIPEFVKTQEFEDVVQKRTVEQIVKRTRLGKDKDNKPLKELAEITKIYRKEFKKNLSKFTKPNKSNQTATGQMLDSVYATVKKQAIEITIPDSSRPKELSGKGDGNTNAKVYRENKKRGRDFFGLAEFEVKALARDIAKALRQFVKSKVNNGT